MVEIERVRTGIDGLDEMLGGGFPKGHIVLILGFCGTGKTTFALQFIWEGLKKGETCAYISLEENEKSMIDTASSYGWDISRYIDEKKLAVVRLDPSNLKNAVTSLKRFVPETLSMLSAQRVAVDPITLFEIMFDDEPTKRNSLFELCSVIKKSGATALFTSETKTDEVTMSRGGLIEYIADGVILLKYIVPTQTSAVKLALRIVKMRRAKHSRKIRPYNITDNGIAVFSETELFGE